MKLKKDTSLVLWAQLKDGNIDALGGLYDLYIDELFSYGMQFSKDKTIVMDSIHDLFLNLFKYRNNLANTDQVKYYLYRSLKNQILSDSKKSFSTQTFALNEEIHSINLLNSVEDQIIATEFYNERSFKLSRAINSLSKKQRQGLFLRFTEERDYEDIAQIMNTSIQTSRTLVYRAIKALRNEMNITLFFLLLPFF